jgi:hypothetical protein
MKSPICFECVHCMKLKMYVEGQAPGIIGTAVQIIEGAACKLASVPIGGPTTTVECSEFQQRSAPIEMRKPSSADKAATEGRPDKAAAAALKTDGWDH